MESPTERGEAPPLRLCMVSDDFLPAATGVGTHLQQVVSFLAARGHQILVITTRRAGQPAMEQWKGVEVIRVPTVKVFGFYQGLPKISDVGAQIERFAPDLMHFHYLSFMMLGLMRLAERKGLPMVYTYHMTEDHLTQPLPMRPFRSLIARQIVQNCNRMDLVITVSGRTAAQLPGRGVTVPVEFISNPVAFTDIDVATADEQSGNQDFKVLFVGRLNPEKNVPYLLQGFALFWERFPRSRLWIAGAGAEEERLRRLCAQLGITEVVSFLGFVDHRHLVGYYAASDVFVLPSFVETQGLVAMEAMRFGKPVLVARSVVSAEELVEEGVNGHIVDERIPTELAAKLLALASDPALVARMGEAGRARSEQYRPDIVIPALEAAYRKVIAGSAAGAT